MNYLLTTSKGRVDDATTIIRKHGVYDNLKGTYVSKLWEYFDQSGLGPNANSNTWEDEIYMGHCNSQIH